MPALNNYQGTMGFLGFAKEAVKGTALASSFWVPFNSESIEHDPGVVSEQLIRQSRSVNVYPVIGQAKVGGAIETLLTIDSSLSLFCAAIGKDLYQTGGASTGSVALSANAAAAATSVSLAAQTGTPIAANDYVELRQTSGAASATNLSEIHKVASVSGTGPYTVTFTSPEALTNAYTSATATVYRLASATATFTHQVLPDQPTVTSYQTFTVEKYLAGLGVASVQKSLQYAGGIVSKMTMKLDNKNPAKITYDFVFTGEAEIAPSTPTYPTSTPIYFQNYAATYYGASDTSFQMFDYTLDNKGQAEWTWNASNYPAVTFPALREGTGKLTALSQDLTYYNNATAGTTGALTLVMTQGVNSITLSLPELIIKKPATKLALGKAILTELDVLAKLNAAANNEISATIVSASYLAY